MSLAGCSSVCLSKTVAVAEMRPAFSELREFGLPCLQFAWIGGPVVFIRSVLGLSPQLFLC